VPDAQVVRKNRTASKGIGMRHTFIGLFAIAAALSTSCKQRSFNGGEVASETSGSLSNPPLNLGSGSTAKADLKEAAQTGELAAPLTKWKNEFQNAYGGRYGEPDWKNTDAVPVCKSWGGSTSQGTSQRQDETRYLTVLRAGGSVSHGSYKDANFSAIISYQRERTYNANGKEISSKDIPGYVSAAGSNNLLQKLFGFKSTDYDAKVISEKTLANGTKQETDIREFFRELVTTGRAATDFNAALNKAKDDFQGRYIAPNLEKDIQILDVGAHTYTRVPETNDTRTVLVMVPYGGSYHGGLNICTNFVMAVDIEAATTTNANKPTYKIKSYGWKVVEDFAKVL
jgi:hypothetical protein